MSQPNIQKLLNLLSIKPDDPQVILAVNQVLNELNQCSPTFDSCRKKAFLYQASGEQELAIEAFKHSLMLNPNWLEGYYHLAYSYQLQEHWHLAIQFYQKALTLKLNTIQLHNNLANCLQKTDRLNEALTHYQNALCLDANHVDVLNNLANLYQEMGRLEEAISTFNLILKLQPDHLLALKNLGKLYQEQGQWEGAVYYYKQLAIIEPSVQLYNQIGSLYSEQSQYDLALLYYQKSLAFDSMDLQTYYHLGNVYLNLNQVLKARHFFKLILEQGFIPEVQYKLLFAIPPIPDSVNHIQQIRQRFVQELHQLTQRNLKLHLNSTLDNFPHSYFLFNYHGLDDRFIQKRLFEFFHQTYPELNYKASYINDYSASPGQPIKLGVISENLYHYSIGKFFKGVLAQLDKTQFEVTLFIFKGKNDKTSYTIKQEVQQVIELPRNLSEVREAVAEAQLDILFYPDIGIEPFTYFLAYSRLAPIQCVTWGHGTTTGLPTIDYFISSEALETVNSENYYSEQLIRLKNLLPYYETPILPSSLKSRQYFQLPEEGNLYLCPQSLFKIHPEFDSILQGILQKDPRGYILLLEPQFQIRHCKQTLMDRFQRVMPDVISRVYFLPRQNEMDFLNLVLLADVLLDPIHLSGGVSGYDCLVTGTPIITMPSQFLRGRITYALYQQMGVEDCIVQSSDAYIEKAVDIATNPQKRNQIKSKILSNLDKVYENPAGVRELERVFKQLLKH